MNFAEDAIRELAHALAIAGTDGILVRSSDPSFTPIPVRFLVRHPGPRDDAIANAYGLSALIVTLPHLAEFVATPPRKFDTLILDETDPDSLSRYGFEAVVQRQASNKTICWTCYVRGKGE